MSTEPNLCSVEIGNLTLLAGANSSGKSSLMQPLLMLKQTLEAPYDPGALLLNGPNVHFTSINQLLSKQSVDSCFSISISINQRKTKLIFQSDMDHGVNIKEMNFDFDIEKDNVVLRPDMSNQEILNSIPRFLRKELSTNQSNKANIIRRRCFLSMDIQTTKVIKSGKKQKTEEARHFFGPGDSLSRHIRYLIHVPGLRGNPERTYNTTGVGKEFPGTFENYVASIIHYWQINQDPKLVALGQALESLGLSWKIEAKRLDSVQVELKVGRLKHGNLSEESDLVSIADVGFGVSQTLPVIVALLTAEPGQLVYLEQPEIHLHPRAQVALAQILAAAAKRGVKVVAETHSSLLLLGVQTLIAEGELDPELVRLHWFTRGEDGTTTISSVTPDETGAFGDWPEDFADVELNAQNRYMSAVEARWSQKK